MYNIQEYLNLVIFLMIRFGKFSAKEYIFIVLNTVL